MIYIFKKNYHILERRASSRIISTLIYNTSYCCVVWIGYYTLNEHSDGDFEFLFVSLGV